MLGGCAIPGILSHVARELMRANQSRASFVVQSAQEALLKRKLSVPTRSRSDGGAYEAI
jgi:hypothetical protein